MLWSVEVDLAVRRPPRADVTVFVTVEAESRISAELTAIGMAMGIHPHTVMAVASRSKGLKLYGEITNDIRAGWAAEAVEAFQSVCRTDDDCAISDLLANLRHLADERGEDWDRLVYMADLHYEAEVAEAVEEEAEEIIDVEAVSDTGWQPPTVADLLELLRPAGNEGV